MSTSYTISVENQRGQNTNYAVFMNPPEFTGGQQSWMNVWYTSFVPHHGNFEMSISANDRLDRGWHCTYGTIARCRTFDKKIIQSFPTITEISPSAIPSAYEIKTGTDFEVPNNTYLVGLAKVNNRGQVAPVASIAPYNNMNIQITPKIKFFVSESHQVPGEIVDYDAVVRDGATIDFSSGEGQGKFYARVIQNTDGKFAVTYYDNFD
ncbi:hypothetical protein THARTR1_06957 [Trichoderma harzianum]|uniref:Uncharacterized protein n=1 Tax=Trichoderma harzianum TaxID=5544 RepID=A0A2K0U3Y5_TRIHA|nr:hypothetical protein THARTR1_06957 [Trichoderma harzianum]